VGVDYQYFAITFLEKSAPICVFFSFKFFCLETKEPKIQGA
jgi:hypothetical protein